MILTGSRYFGQPVLSVPTADLGMQQCVFSPPRTFPRNFTYYTVKHGDRFDLIAANVYGVSEYWYKIANANPEVWYPEMLTPGAVIRIPA